MYKLFNISAINVCLVVALLWAQTALVQHNLEHISHDATEVCEVYTSADNDKALANVTSTVIHFDFSRQATSNVVSSLIEFSPTASSARAPPLFTS